VARNPGIDRTGSRRRSAIGFRHRRIPRVKVLAASLGIIQRRPIPDCLHLDCRSASDGAIRSGDGDLFSPSHTAAGTSQHDSKPVSRKNRLRSPRKRVKLPDFVGEVLAVVQAVLRKRETRAALGRNSGLRDCGQAVPGGTGGAGLLLDDEIADGQRRAARRPCFRD